MEDKTIHKKRVMVITHPAYWEEAINLASYHNLNAKEKKTAREILSRQIVKEMNNYATYQHVSKIPSYEEIDKNWKKYADKHKVSLSIHWIEGVKWLMRKLKAE